MKNAIVLASLLALLIPGAQLVLMPDTGHFAPLEQPAEFNRIVRDYLDRGMFLGLLAEAVGE